VATEQLIRALRVEKKDEERLQWWKKRISFETMGTQYTERFDLNNWWNRLRNADRKTSVIRTSDNIAIVDKLICSQEAASGGHTEHYFD